MQEPRPQSMPEFSFCSRRDMLASCRRARSSMSTWTRSMRRSNSATILSFGAVRWRSVTAPSAAWWPQRATRPAPSACARPCRPPPPCANARTLVFVPPRFDVYRAVSRQIHAIFADYTSLIEPLSLDEAYLDVTAGPAWPADRIRHGEGDPRAHSQADRVSRRQRASPTTSSSPSLHPASASRMASSSSPPRWVRTSSPRCRSPGFTGSDR